MQHHSSPRKHPPSHATTTELNVSATQRHTNKHHASIRPHMTAQPCSLSPLLLLESRLAFEGLAQLDVGAGLTPP